MLKYFIQVTEDLLVAGILVGMLFGYIGLVSGRRGRKILVVGAAAGLAAALVMSIVKNNTRLVDTGMWNVRIFTVSLIAAVLFLVFSARRKGGDRLLPVLAAALAFTYLFYACPDVYAYPFSFNLGGESFYSTAFFFRLAGFLLGILLALLICLASDRTARRLEPGLVRTLLWIEILLNAVQQIMKVIQVLLAKRLIPSNHTLFTLAKHASNYSDLFIYLSMLAALVMPVLLWIRSFHVNEPYENPAQHRKIRAAWRNTRRWSTLLMICFLFGVLALTLFTRLSTQTVELSPAEDCEVRDGAVYVSLEQVADGHLHRFVYTTENGVDVRFIVIKKPNATAYGVGLDACDICGETGYYERSGQVVCSLCDVVMNINTIGFKGGCNPIVIDYTVENGYIIVPVETLVEHENEFK